MNNVAHDPITLEILSNALRSVADETFVALRKSAFSNNLKERADHSTALFDAKGRLIVQSQQSLPIHVGGIAGTIRVLLEKFGDDVHEGDVFVGNDPYVAAGTHLPDICISTPVFHSGQLVGFSACTAHHADIGGANVGGSAGGLTEIYQEGLRIPLVRLFSRGKLVSDVFDILLLNVRGSEERKGDYNAQVAAVSLGARRLIDICNRFGQDFVEAAFDELVNRTRARMQGALAAIPEGDYFYEDVMDDDGIRTRALPVKVRIGQHNGRLTVDFEGTSVQAEGNINSPFNDTVATVMFVLRSVLDPAITTNHGLFDAIDVIAPAGSLVNPSFPAGVTNRSLTDQRICDVVLGALSAALPDRVLAASNGSNTGIYIYGTDPRNGAPFYFFETMGGGLGARCTKDGKDAVQVGITNTANSPIEAIERDFPLLVEEYVIAADSGGAGRYRGGCGLRRVIRPLAHCTFGGVGERFDHHPWGLHGGEEGETGFFAIEDADGTLQRLPNKISKASVTPRQRIVMQTAGAGGMGPPAERAREALEEDLQSGKFSEQYLKSHYGFDERAQTELPVDLP
jgi:N-methylhydantoinase B